MKYCRGMLISVLVGVGLNAGAIVSVSDATGGPYTTIPRRNVFGLLPLVSSRTEPNTPAVSRPKITLAGITSLLGYKTVFLMLPPIKAGGARECLLLREGETKDEIQVREIGDQTVRVVNHGEEQSLSFDDNPPEPPTVPDVVSAPVDQRSPVQMPAPEKPSLTPEQQMLVIEAQRMKALQDGDPIAKILPPTEFTAEITDGTP